MNEVAISGIKDIVNIPLVSIDNGVVVANTQQMEGYISRVKKYNDEIIKSSISIIEIEEAIKFQRDAFVKIETYRKGYTSGFDAIKDVFTKDIEPKIKEEYLRLEAHKAFLLEGEYKITEALITEEFEILLKENSFLGMNIDMFHAFISKNRTLAGMKPKENGKLAAPSIVKILGEFDKLAQPVRAAKETERSLIREQKLFESAISSIGVATATTMEDISKCRVKLDELSHQLVELYPNYSIIGKNTIENNKSLLRSREAVIENQFTQPKVEEDEAHDAIIMQKVQELSLMLSGQLFKDMGLLKSARLELIHHYSTLKSQSNKDKVAEIGQELKSKINEIEDAKQQLTIQPLDEILAILAIEDGGEVYEPTFRLVGTRVNDVKKVVKFMRLLNIKFEEIK